MLVVFQYPFKTITAVKLERCGTAGASRDFNNLYLITRMSVLLQGQSWHW